MGSVGFGFVLGVVGLDWGAGVGWVVLLGG